MYNINEVIVFLQGLGITLILVVLYPRIRLLPRSNLLLSSFAAMVMVWLLTIVEGYIWPDLLNQVEHFLGMLSAFLLTSWIWLIQRDRV